MTTNTGLNAEQLQRLLGSTNLNKIFANMQGIEQQVLNIQAAANAAFGTSSMTQQLARTIQAAQTIDPLGPALRQAMAAIQTTQITNATASMASLAVLAEIAQSHQAVAQQAYAAIQVPQIPDILGPSARQAIAALNSTFKMPTYLDDELWRSIRDSFTTLDEEELARLDATDADLRRDPDVDLAIDTAASALGSESTGLTYEQCRLIFVWYVSVCAALYLYVLFLEHPALSTIAGAAGLGGPAVRSAAGRALDRVRAWQVEGSE